MATPGESPDMIIRESLKEAVQLCQWRSVIKQVWHSDLSDEERQWAIERTASNAPECFVKVILDDICSDNQRDSVLSFLFTRCLWKYVGHVLQCNISRKQHRRAVEEASKCADEHEFISYILPHCLNGELEEVLTHLVSRHLWKSVGLVLQHNISRMHHRWAVEEASKHAEEDDFADYILHHCTHEELEQVLTHMVSRGLWESEDNVAHSDISNTQHILSQIVSQGLWKAVGRFLQRDISSTQHRWAVEEASKHAEEDDFADYILHHCTHEELEQVLTHMVSRGLWESEDNVAHSDISSTQHILSQIVSQGLWKAVGRFLQRDISSTQHRWAVEEASKHAEEDDFADYILYHCTHEELEQVLTHMVSRGLWESEDNVAHSDISSTQHVLSQIVSQGLWKAVGRFLQRDISSTQHTWAVEEASKHADDDHFVEYILPQCGKEELEYALNSLVSRGLWRSVGQVLKRGIDTKLHIMAVEEASRRAYDRQFYEYILPNCHKEELEHSLTCLVSQRLRPSEEDMNISIYGWPFEGVCRHAHGDDFNDYILCNCLQKKLYNEATCLALQDNQLWNKAACLVPRDKQILVWQLLEISWDMLTEQLRRPVVQVQWKFVGEMLKLEGLDTTLRIWVIKDAIKCAVDDHFNQYILPWCHKEELEQVILCLVSENQWISLGELLKRDIDVALHGRAVEEARKFAPADDFVTYILPQCYKEELEHVLTCCMSQGHWRLLSKVLKRSIDTKLHRWVVEEASKCASADDFIEYVLPQCHLEELECVLTYFVSRGQWRLVEEVFKRDIDTKLHRWVVEEASKHADGYDFVVSVLPFCHDEELVCVVVAHLVSRGQWMAVDRVVEQSTNTMIRRRIFEEACKHACDDLAFEFFILSHCTEDDDIAMFPLLVVNKKWKCIRKKMCDVLCDTLYTWVRSGHGSKAHDTLFWKFIHSCHVEVSLALDLTKAVTQNTENISSALTACVSLEKSLCELLIISLLNTLCYVVCSDVKEYRDSTEQTKQCVCDIFKHITTCIEDNTDSLQGSTLKIIQNKEKWTAEFTKIANTHRTDSLFLLHFLQGLKLYHDSRRGQKDDAILLVMFTVLPLFPQLQSVALRIMLREKRWDVISQACLSHVWEHDRRLLFTAAVEQGQWSVVQQWSDHTVHDDQREWAMKEAFREGQWEVYLLLADHGLTMPEQMHAHYMVAKYADWDTVLQMVERGGDLTEVSELLENYVTKQLRRKPQGDYLQRCKDLIKLRLYLAKYSALFSMKALKRCKWRTVLFNILHEPTENYFSLVMNKAIKEQAWHVLMHLVRLGMKAAERDWLFPEMVRQQQWGVCRMLLEYGVDVQLCLKDLPELMERNQWTLVARVMEYEVDDALRQQVMQLAFQRREGALFWHCLTTMKDKEDLSLETREKLFHQAISRDIWQAVKPLVGRYSPGIQHRDIAFLEAIEQHLWDVVDHCQLYRADINMKDENGETPLHREARKEEWKAVKEIVLRDGNPNLLNKEGVSILNRLIHDNNWDLVKTVIKYGGNIHLCARFIEDIKTIMHTPLQALIEKRQMDIVQFMLIWCPDQWKGVNDAGETTLHAACGEATLHAACDSYRTSVVWDLIARKVDPLAVTKTGQSALVYAVLNRKCPQRMVAECSKLGFSTHQPSLTDLPENLLDDVIHAAVRMSTPNNRFPFYKQYSAITSPLLCAVLRDLPVVTLMLYESGSCSYAELFTLYTQLSKLVEERRKLQELALGWFPWQRGDEYYSQCYTKLTQTVEKYLAFLRKVATTPRSLKSSCRLLISHCLSVHAKRRLEHVDQFSLPVELINYLKFSEMCDPDWLTSFDHS